MPSTADEDLCFAIFAAPLRELCAQKLSAVPRDVSTIFAVKIFPVTLEASPAADFYARTLDRIRRNMIALGVAGLATSWVYFGWRTGIGFGLGASVAYVNFYWLRKVVAGLAELAAKSGTPPSSGVVVRRFLLRYFLLTIVAFVILSVSRESLYGLFAGLFLPVVAILCEAAYEIYAVLVRRNSTS